MTIHINFGVCNLITYGFMIFLHTGGRRHPCRSDGGDLFWIERGVVHDYKYKVWRMYLDYSWFYEILIIRVVPPLEPPLKVLGGDWFWGGRGVVHDYTHKVWSLLLYYFYFF